MGITRKQFLKGALGVAVGGFGLQAVAACGDDAESGPSTSSSGTSSTAGGGSAGGSGGGGSCANGAESLDSAISSNHPGGEHALTVAAADIAAAVDKTYSIKGASGHDHSVTVTAAHFATLQDGGAVADVPTEPDSTGHSHKVTISCA
jgi:hypothetical protein